ncbi:type I restriction endonuclease subunit R [Mesorhizobium sp. KR1-2]|uniref:type I restriction endonuclease subunit R n=1 Tax=Mesorhizobium sp. KR1-2 TaxID=3156609 RepID=UPI0032B35EF8
MNYIPSVSIFPPHDIETMNEDDVAGEIVRPFCRALGYTQGNPEANLRSQFSLQYDKAFLGHQDGKKDPVLRGRPDFICEVISYTRWVIEAKAPSVSLSIADSFQAHTYATHPEIAAEYYLLTNGREFQLFRVGKPDEAVWSWRKEDVDELLPALKGFLGPEAMKKRANVIIDKGKPLASGFGSSMEIIGGHIVYINNKASFTDVSSTNGLVNTISGNRIFRTDDGLVSGEVSINSAFAEMDAIFEAFNFFPLRFHTSEEYLSTDRNTPTLMQNLITVRMMPGMEFPKTLLSPGGVLPFEVKATAYTEILGFVDGSDLKGTFVMDCAYEIPAGSRLGFPTDLSLLTEGTFEAKVR